MKPPVMSLPPDALRQILLLRTLEETDALGKVIPMDVREQATRQAAQTPDFLWSRADWLIRRCSDNLARILGRVIHPPLSFLKYAGWFIVILAGILGWCTNELGPDRIVDILAFPLLGLVIWNLAVFAVMIFPRRAKTAGTAKAFPDSGRFFDIIEKRLVGDHWEGPQRGILSRALVNFLQKWHERTAAVTRAKHLLVFHAAALALAGGIVAGMYYHGLRKEYRASWESTFLNPSSLHTLLKTALGPASAVTGISIPSEQALAEIRTSQIANPSPAGGNAAPFIHLWATTAGLFIGLPRLLLIALALRRLAAGKPDDASLLSAMEASYRAEAAGQTSLVTIRPVYFEPDAATQEAVRLCVLHLWGGKARLHFLPKVELGDEEGDTGGEEAPEDNTVLVFSFASTPEQDVHGEFMRAMAAHARELLVITDALGFHARHHDMPEYAQRFSQRREAWHRVIGDSLPWLVITPELLKNPLPSLDPIRAQLRTKGVR